MTTPRPVTQADYDRVRELHAQGMSRNEIGRTIGRSGRTISRLAQELGLSFERSGATAKATEARKADAATRRARIEEQALASAERLLKQMWKPALVFNFGGRENDYNSTTLEEPPFSDKRAIATSVQALMQTALKIAEHDRADAATSGVDEWLKHMTEDGDDE
ncbi:helix-turn-helix domain containing protein [Salinispora arenicola]|uniref:helix-turn-helix domain containing protein n=1 Tax=Salinispora arenicola TaxID=168697 RepID=UPI00036989F0|nr:helix-turn-helix domain containing protein [Salinispora arenicola]